MATSALAFARFAAARLWDETAIVVSLTALAAVAATAAARRGEGDDEIPTRAAVAAFAGVAIAATAAARIAGAPFPVAAAVFVAGATVAWWRRDDLARLGVLAAADPLLAPKATGLGILAVYALYRWWGLQRALLGSLPREEVTATVRGEVAAFALSVVGLYAVVAAIGLAALTALQLLWRWLVPRVEHAIAARDPVSDETLDRMRSIELPYVSYGGSLLLVLAFGWLLLSGSSRDVAEAVLVGLGVATLFLVVSAIREITILRDLDVPDHDIHLRLRREAGTLVLYALTGVGALVGVAAVADAALAGYLDRAIRPAAATVSPGTVELLAAQSTAPGDVVAYYAFLERGTLAPLTIRLLAVAVPAGVALLALPYLIKYLYFVGVRRAGLIVATYVGFVAVEILVDLTLSGEIAHLGHIGVASVVPTVGAATANEIVSWYKEQMDYRACPTCGQRASHHGTYCEYCGAEIAEE